MILMRVLGHRLHNEFGGDAGSSGGGGDFGGGGASGSFDVGAAADSIGAELFGSSEREPEDAPGSEGESPAPAPAPSPTPDPSPSPAPSPSPSPSPSPAPAPAVKPGRFTAEAAPTTWKPELAAQWQALPPSVREEIARRENDMFAGLEQYKTDATFAREVKGLLAPVAPLLQQHNVAPNTFVGNIIRAHLHLSSNIGEAEKIATVRQLLQGYGVDPAKLVEGGQPPADAPYVDPEVKALREQVSSLQSRINGSDARAAEARRAELAKEINDFASDPANEFFDQVADEIAILIRGSGGTMTLRDAYDRAIWANPTVKAQLLARDSAAAVEKAQKEAREKAEAAARASKGRGVRTSGHQGGGTASTESMDDTMAATLAGIRKRGNS